ncbi:MAG: class I SAM-dependent RNA methyltransferase [Flavobacteriales bacterium]
MNDNIFKISISTLPFLEPVLAEELNQLGAADIEIGKRIVHCVASKKLLYRANLHLRTALRVFVPIHTFNIRHSDELYKRAVSIDWTEFLSLDKTFAIDPNVHSVMFKHTNFASLRLKDGIADFFQKNYGKRPSVDADNPDVLFNLHIDEHRVTLSLDSSGESMNRRGYRVAGAQAPINEVLAAGMLLLSGWKGESNLYDPMCGSGTLAIEAAMIATNTPALHKRLRPGFANWKSFDEELWTQVQQEAEQNIKPLACKIFASDVDRRQLDVAKKNIELAGFSKHIQVSMMDFFETHPQDESGTLVFNPPYGERLETADINHIYKRIGSHLKHDWPGHRAWIISSNAEALKHIGLKPSKKFSLMNGTLDCKYQLFDLFAGKRAEHKSNIAEAR